MSKSSWPKSPNFGKGGGGSGGGGFMFRAPGRVSRTSVNGSGGGGGTVQQDCSFSSSSDNSKKLGLVSPTGSGSGSSSSFCLSRPNSPTAGNNNNDIVWGLSPSFTDEFEWEYLEEEGRGEEKDGGDGIVFGNPPSVDEVEDALVSLQQVFSPAFVKDGEASNQDKDVPVLSPAASTRSASSTRSELDWKEPPLQLCDLRMGKSFNRMHDVMHLLQTEPSVQRMVVSLSSDSAVWNAVLNNEIVREIRDSLGKGKEKVPQSSGDSRNPLSIAAGVLSWIFENSKAKFMEVVTNFTNLVSSLFQTPDARGKDDDEDFNEKLRASFMLTIIVLFVVVVTRANSG